MVGSLGKSFDKLHDGLGQGFGERIIQVRKWASSKRRGLGKDYGMLFVNHEDPGNSGVPSSPRVEARR